MELLEKINNDLALSIKEQDHLQIKFLRNIKTNLTEFSKKKKNKNKVLINKDYQNCLVDYIIEQKITYNLLKNLGKLTEAEVELDEAKFAASYLPIEITEYLFLDSLTSDGLKAYISNVIAINNYNNISSVGKIMQHLKSDPSLKGRIDMKLATDISKELLEDAE